MVKRLVNRLSIRAKALIAFVGVTGLVLGVTSWLIIFQAKRYLTDQHAMAALGLAESLSMATDVAATTGDRHELHRLAKSWQSLDDVLYVRIENADGKLLAESGTCPWNGPLSLGDGESRVFSSFTVGSAAVHKVSADPADSDLAATDYSEVKPTIGALTTNIARVQVATTSEALRAEITSKTILIVGIFACAGTATYFLTWLGISNLSRRLLRLNAASDRISRGDLGDQFHDESKDEIGRLACAFESMRHAIQTRDNAMRDFSGRLQDEVRIRTADLEQAMKASEAASRAKSNFLANMSHEIRTHMMAILGNADLLSEADQSSEERQERVSTIQRSGEHLLQLINDVLDISKIEAGKMDVEEIVCSPQSLLLEVRTLMEPRAKSKKLELVVECDGALPETIRSDPMRLRQILLNLISNAVKFTQAGSITLRVSARAIGQDGELVIKVIDSGIGMPPASVARLFQAFQQADSTMSRRFGGTGLGLAIAQRLANLLHGDISVESRLGAGSTFTLRVRTGSLEGVPFSTGLIQQVVQVDTKPLTFGSLTGASILLVEDGIDNQRLIVHHLTKAGAKVTIAENGQVGIDTFEESLRTGSPFQLILMDMQMPLVDGYTATARLREAGYKVPIVALTAHALSGDRERCLSAGCDDYATKPLKRETLLRLCDQWLTRPSGSIAA